MKRLIQYLLSLTVLGVILSCNGAGMLLDIIEDNVMVANAMYLEVVDFFPLNGDSEVNTGQDIVIKFDRPVLESSILENLEILNISNDTEWQLTQDQIEYNSSLNTLTINPIPYLTELNNYDITIKPGFLSIDGEKLREPLTWSFLTTNAPVGSIEYKTDGKGDADPGFTGPVEDSVDIFISASTITKYYAYSLDIDVLNGITADNNSTRWATIDSNETVNIDLSGMSSSDSLTLEEGVVTFYFVFADITKNTITEIDSISTIYDSIAPVFSLDPDTLYENIGNEEDNPTDNAGVIVETNLSNGLIYQWESTGATTLNFGSAASSSTTVYSLSDTKTASYRLTVTDAAGNTSSDDRSFVRDTIVPPTPTLLNRYTTTNDDTPTWNWTVDDPENDVDHYLASATPWGWGPSYGSEITSNTYTQTITEDRDYTFYLVSVDAAGNRCYRVYDDFTTD